MSGLILRGARKSFGAVEVIKGVDLKIEPNDFVVFVGPSGCGKSTLLRMIAGLEEITSGDLEIGGVRMNDIDPSKRGIAMVFQTYALYPHMTVAQNMGFALRFAGISKEQVRSQVDNAARILELGPLMDRYPKQLSGGQRQRVAIGRAIVRNPKVFLFDEPLSNLDAELRVHMRIEIARLHKEVTTTVIYVTHDQVEAMTLADKIVVMRDGSISQVGTPLDLYDDPDNLFVAGFIGSPRMNFFQGVVEEATAGSAAVRLSDFGNQVVRVPGLKSIPAAGGNVTLGIRPEHFNTTGSAVLPLTIDIVEHLGGESFAYARATDGHVVTVSLRDSGRELKAGDPLAARFDPAVALLFDSGEHRVR